MSKRFNWQKGQIELSLPDKYKQMLKAAPKDDAGLARWLQNQLRSKKLTPDEVQLIVENYRP